LYLHIASAKGNKTPVDVDGGVLFTLKLLMRQANTWRSPPHFAPAEEGGDGNAAVFLHALSTVARAKGMSEIARALGCKLAVV